MQKIIIKDAPTQERKQTRFSELKQRQWYKGLPTVNSSQPIMFMLDGITADPKDSAYRVIELEETHIPGHAPRITARIGISEYHRLMWDVEPVTLDSVTFVKQGAV